MSLDASSCWEVTGHLKTEQRRRLVELLDEYLTSVENGNPLDTEELRHLHPDLDCEIRDCLSGLQLFRDATVEFASKPIVTGQDDTKLDSTGGTLGDFQILREIGRGGMGVVYEAQQLSLDRRVALKVLPFAVVLDEKQLGRFKNEAQAAAHVNHPNIVPVFAIGQQRGVHYYAMQFIEGQSLTELIVDIRQRHGYPELKTLDGDETVDASTRTGVNRPDKSSRLGSTTLTSSDTAEHIQSVAEFGMQAARALHAAHEFGVVHRDVKPSNLLVDHHKKLWVADFGLARCRNNATLTQTGDIVGTIRYMSPEQARGESALIDHRTDVFSLGVTLYELATLEHPLADISDAQILHELRDPHWPTLREKNRSIPSDFENIVLKAMEADREDRYETAQDMAEDLVRFLNGQPIVARPPSVSTRVAKWAKRHQRAVLAATLMLVFLVAGLSLCLAILSEQISKTADANITIAKNNVELQQKNDELEASNRLLKKTLQEIEGGAAALANIPGAQPVHLDMVELMLDYYEKQADEADDDRGSLSKIARARGKMGSLSRQIGSLNEAKQSYREAIAIHSKLAANSPEVPSHARNAALCQNNLGQILRSQGDLQAAEQAFEAAIELQTRLSEREPLAVQDRANLATTRGNLAMLLAATGRTSEAKKLLGRVVASQKQLCKAAPKQIQYQLALATSYNNQSSLCTEEDVKQALELHQGAAAIQKRVVQQLPDDEKILNELAASYNNIGFLHSREENWQDAEENYLSAIRIQEQLVEASPDLHSYAADLAITHNNLGMVQSKAGNIQESFESFQTAGRKLSRLVAAQPGNVGLASGLAGVYNNLGMALQRMGHSSHAARSFKRAIVLQDQVHRRAPNIAQFREMLSKHYFNYGHLLRILNDPESAAEFALKRRSLWSKSPSKLVSVAEELAAACKLMDEESHQRERYLRDAITTLELAIQAGLKDQPDFTQPPFDILPSHPDYQRLSILVSRGEQSAAIDQHQASFN